jgi:hypothetical protein
LNVVGLWLLLLLPLLLPLLPPLPWRLLLLLLIGSPAVPSLLLPCEAVDCPSLEPPSACISTRWCILC